MKSMDNNISTPTFDDFLNTPFDDELVLDADLQTKIDAATADAIESQQVRNTVHALFLIAERGTMRDLYQAMQAAFTPLPSRSR